MLIESQLHKLRSLAKKIIKVATLQEFEDFLVKKK